MTTVLVTASLLVSRRSVNFAFGAASGSGAKVQQALHLKSPCYRNIYSVIQWKYTWRRKWSDDGDQAKLSGPW